MAHVGVLKLEHLLLYRCCLTVEIVEADGWVALEHHYDRSAVVGKVLGLQQPWTQFAYKFLVGLVGKQEVAGVLELQTLGIDLFNSLAVALYGSCCHIFQFLALIAAESVSVLS